MMMCKMNRHSKTIQGELEVTQRISKHQDCVVKMIKGQWSLMIRNSLKV